VVGCPDSAAESCIGGTDGAEPDALPEAPLSDELQQLLAKGASRSLVTTLGHAAGSFMPWYRYFGHLIHEGVVDLDVKEAARLRVAALNDCPFCMQMRARHRDGTQILEEGLAVAAQAGARDHPGFTDEQLLALDVAEQMFTAPGDVSDAAFDRLRAQWSDAQLVELGLAVAEYIGMGRLFKFMGLRGSPLVPPPEANS
jgi:AhpD family alkylhydroperoxidase